MSNEPIYELVRIHHDNTQTPLTHSKDIGQLEASRAVMMANAPDGVVYLVRQVQKVTNEWRVVEAEELES